jgi:hypothetical protein
LERLSFNLNSVIYIIGTEETKAELNSLRNIGGPLSSHDWQQVYDTKRDHHLSGKAEVYFLKSFPPSPHLLRLERLLQSGWPSGQVSRDLQFLSLKQKE